MELVSGRTDTNAEVPLRVDADGNLGVIGGASGPSGSPLGDQQLTNAQLATSQALTVPTGAKTAIIQNNHSQPMRWRDNGQAPTATVGQRLAAGQTLVYNGDLTAFRIIKETDGTGTVDIWYGG